MYFSNRQFLDFLTSAKGCRAVSTFSATNLRGERCNLQSAAGQLLVWNPESPEATMLLSAAQRCGIGQAAALCVTENCRFGVKSGSHGDFAGVSCLDDGIQFDLVKLNSITIQDGRRTAVIAPGNT